MNHHSSSLHLSVYICPSLSNMSCFVAQSNQVHPITKLTRKTKKIFVVILTLNTKKKTNMKKTNRLKNHPQNFDRHKLCNNTTNGESQNTEYYRTPTYVTGWIEQYG